MLAKAVRQSVVPVSVLMKRSVVRLDRSCRRYLSDQVGTSASVPDDPDILTTQSPILNPTQHEAAAPDSLDIDLSKPYPRLQYNAPRLGVNPAYDLALEVLRDARRRTQGKLQSTADKIARIEASPQPALDRIAALKLHHRRLAGLVDIDDPEVRWRAARGDVDLTQPIYRDLLHTTWQAKECLLIKQRIAQMFVTPDVIPLIAPTVNVTLSFPGRTRGHRKGRFEIGELLTTNDAAALPAIEIQSFEDAPGTYTVAIVDPDVPHQETDSFTSFLHFLQTDIHLTPTQHAIADNGTVVHDWIPGHPHKGTQYHRYTVLVWRHAVSQGSSSSSTDDVALRLPVQPSANLSLKQGAKIPREGFHAQNFARQNGVHAVGINFWRQVWDEDVAACMAEYPSVKYIERNYRPIKA